jgi:hypothetical protein
MAISKNNVITHGWSGKFGDQIVFSQKNGLTVVGAYPRTSEKVTEKQLIQRKHFQRAIIYGKGVYASPEDKAVYEFAAKKGKSPFNVAVADFLNAPNIDSIDFSDYTGQPGEAIRINASDDFLVKSVTVSIINADGSLVEEGNAQSDASGYVWTYTTTQNNDSLEGDKIIVSASDLSGNVTREEKEL